MKVSLAVFPQHPSRGRQPAFLGQAIMPSFKMAGNGLWRLIVGATLLHLAAAQGLSDTRPPASTFLSPQQSSVLNKYLPQDEKRLNTVRTAWPPHASAKAVTLHTLDGSWTFDPANRTTAGAMAENNPIVVFVVVDLSVEYVASAFRWDDILTGMDAWALRNTNMDFVFIPASEASDADKIKAQAQAQILAADQAFWLPRFHFSTDTVMSLRAGGSWITDYVDAWSAKQPTIAVIKSAADDQSPSTMQVIDGTESKNGLTFLPTTTTTTSSCGADVPDGLCGGMAFYGLACPQQDANQTGTNDEPMQDVHGKVAVIERGSCTFIDKITAAKAHGATGVVLLTDERPRGAWLGPDETADPIPAVLIDQEPGQALKDALTKSTGEKAKVVMFERAMAPWAFAIDAEGALRPLMSWPSTTSSSISRPSLALAILEAKHLLHEADLKDGRQDFIRKAATVVPVLNGTWDYDTVFTLPKEAPRERLFVYLELRCSGRLESTCPTTPQIIKVRICPAAQGDDGSDSSSDNTDTALAFMCQTDIVEIARVISPAGREMTALMEVTEFISLLPPEGKTAHLSIQGPPGYFPYVELILPPRKSNTDIDGVSSFGTPVPTSVTKLSMREENTVTVSKDVSYIRIMGFLTVMTDATTNTNTPQQQQQAAAGEDPAAGAVTTVKPEKVSKAAMTKHVFRLSTGGKCEVPLRDRGDDVFLCFNESAYFGAVVPAQRGELWYTGQNGWCPGSVVIPFTCNVVLFDDRKDAPGITSKNLTITYHAEAAGDLQEGGGANDGPLTDEHTVHPELSAFLVLTTAVLEAPDELAWQQPQAAIKLQPTPDFRVALSPIKHVSAADKTTVLISWIPPSSGPQAHAPVDGPPAAGAAVPPTHYLVTVTAHQGVIGDEKETFLLPVAKSTLASNMTTTSTNTLQLANVIKGQVYSVAVAAVSPAGTGKAAETSFSIGPPVEDDPSASTTTTGPAATSAAMGASSTSATPAAAQRSSPSLASSSSSPPSSSTPSQHRRSRSLLSTGTGKLVVGVVGVAMMVGVMATVGVLALRRHRRFHAFNETPAGSSNVAGQQAAADIV